jgi:ADP-heptose:LPS heptosyltransferase
MTTMQTEATGLSAFFEHPPKRIAVFRALHLGDLLCAVPAFRALRAYFPEARIELIGLPWARQFVERFSRYIDGFIEFPGFPGLPEQMPQLGALPAFLADLQSRNFDLAVQMHGNGNLSNSVVSCFGSKLTAGHCIPGCPVPDARTFLPWRERENEVKRCLRLLEVLGIAAQGEALEFPLSAADSLALSGDSGLASALDRPYVCIHPGARNRRKCWAPDDFAAVADGLAEAGYRIVLTGSADESDLTARVRDKMSAWSACLDTSSLNLAVGTLAAVLQKSSLLVSNDTGVSHLAAALQTPSVIIFSTTDPDRWAPLNRDLHRVVQNPTGPAGVEAVLAQARRALGPAGRQAIPVEIHESPSSPGARAAKAPAQLDILIPTYHRPQALAVTLTSLCAQTLGDLRIVVSDQSDDGSALSAPVVQTPLRLLRAQGHEVELHHHVPRRGLAEHRQFLLDQVKAPYCLFLDDDILVEPDLPERMLSALMEEACGFVGSAVIGLSYAEDVRPHQQCIDFWEGPVEPEEIRPGSREWNRHVLHNAANLWHVQRRLGLNGRSQRKYRVAWVGACVLYDAAKLRACGGFSFWRDLPREHCGEDVLAQTRVMRRYGGCGLIPSGAYHQELPTTIVAREFDAPYVLSL